jgi:hypothetical protein
MKIRWAGALVLVLAAALLTGCEDATGPGVEPEIRNIADSFEFQVSKLDRYTGTLTYAWSNSGALANVNQSAALSGGSALLTIADGRGTQVYSRSVSENGTFVTTQGQAGSWQLRVAFTDATGTLNFRVQKRP